jgi:hypothetical protein
MARPNRLTLRAAARFAVVLALLVVPWPGLGRPVAQGFGTLARVLLAPVLALSDQPVSFAPADPGDARHEWSLMVSVKSAQTSSLLRQAKVDLRRSGYLQLAFFFALVAGWPGRTARRLAFVSAVGFALLSSLALLPILMFFGIHQVVRMSSWFLLLLTLVYRTLLTATGMAYAVPGILWLVLAKPLDGSAFMQGEAALPAGGPEGTPAYPAGDR